MARQFGVANSMFAALARESINIQMITTSEIKISVLVERDEALNALRAVHREFQLEIAPPSAAEMMETPVRHPQADAADVVERLRDVDMENLVIDEISLDDTQGRVTISGVPDTPGVAARIFREVAQAGIFVDMIVQSHDSHADHASLTFTIPQDQVDAAAEVARQMVEQLACKGVSSCPAVAKLSVCGVGLRSHTGVAIRLFEALAEAGVNVALINTSEVHVNVVVDGADGAKALGCLKAAFADVLK
jgi:aspartate kinase